MKFTIEGATAAEVCELLQRLQSGEAQKVRAPQRERDPGEIPYPMRAPEHPSPRAQPDEPAPSPRPADATTPVVMRPEAEPAQPIEGTLTTELSAEVDPLAAPEPTTVEGVHLTNGDFAAAMYAEPELTVRVLHSYQKNPRAVLAILFEQLKGRGWTQRVIREHRIAMLDDLLLRTAGKRAPTFCTDRGKQFLALPQIQQIVENVLLEQSADIIAASNAPAAAVAPAPDVAPVTDMTVGGTPVEAIPNVTLFNAPDAEAAPALVFGDAEPAAASPTTPIIEGDESTPEDCTRVITATLTSFSDDLDRKQLAVNKLKALMGTFNVTTTAGLLPKHCGSFIAEVRKIGAEVRAA